jgi:hypothetical protein
VGDREDRKESKVVLRSGMIVVNHVGVRMKSEVRGFESEMRLKLKLQGSLSLSELVYRIETSA